MLVTASWGGEAVAVEVGADCRSVGALKRCLEEALPDLDLNAVCLEVGGRPVDDEAVIKLAEGSVIDISATPAALAAATLRGEGWPVDFGGFCDAAEQGDLRRCKLYLEAVGVVWPSGVDTPLHCAVRRDRREVVKLLLDAGCDKDAKTDRGVTPLLLATSQDSLQLVKLLVDADCDKEAKTKHGYTALHGATSKGSMRLAKLLLDSGCDKDAKTKYNETPLRIAICNENRQLVKLLVDAGCSQD